MVHRIRHPLSFAWPFGLRSGVVPRRRRFSAHKRHLTAVVLVAAMGSLQLGCEGRGDEGESALARTPAATLRLDGRVESLTDVARIETLFVPNTRPESARHVALQTDGRGRALTRIMLPEAHCLNAVLDSAADASAHELALRVRTTGYEQLEDRTLVVSRTHATALPVASLCPTSETALSLEIDVRGAPNADYQLHLYVTESDALERGVFAQGRRDLPGFNPHGPLQSDTLAENRRGSYPLAVTPERCIAVVAYADEELTDIDARFVSLTGEQLALEVATDRASVLGPYCTFDPEVIRVEFRAYEGQGNFRWQVWDSPTPTGRRLLAGRQSSATGAISAELRRELQDSTWPANRSEEQRRQTTETR